MFIKRRRPVWIVFLVLLVLTIIFICSQFENVQIREGIIIGIGTSFTMIFIFIIISAGAFINSAREERQQLFRFFGITHNKPSIHIYVSRVEVTKSRSYESEPIRRGFTGDALTVPDYAAAQEVRKLFQTQRPERPRGLCEILSRIHCAVTDIDPLIEASPTPDQLKSSNKYLSTSNLVVIGSILYNAVSHYYLTQQTSTFYFDTKSRDDDDGTPTERILKVQDKKCGEVELDGRAHDRELAIIERIRDRKHNNTTVVICAGLGSNATLESALYLKEHWEELQHNYKRSEFALCLAFEGLPPDPPDPTADRAVGSPTTTVVCKTSSPSSPPGTITWDEDWPLQ